MGCLYIALVALLLGTNYCAADVSDIKDCQYTADNGDKYDLSPLIAAK